MVNCNGQHWTSFFYENLQTINIQTSIKICALPNLQFRKNSMFYYIDYFILALWRQIDCISQTLTLKEFQYDITMFYEHFKSGSEIPWIPWCIHIFIIPLKGNSLSVSKQNCFCHTYNNVNIHRNVFISLLADSPCKCAVLFIYIPYKINIDANHSWNLT